MSIQVDHRPQAQFGGMGYDPMRYTAQPHFTNPWGAAPQQQHHAAAQAPVYQSPVSDSHVSRSPAMQIPSYSHGMQQASALQADLINQRAYGSSIPAQQQQQQASYPPTSAPRYSPEYAHNPNSYTYDADHSRRSSFAPHSGRGSISEHMEPQHPMVPLNDDMTPRNIYGSRQGSHDSYGFPSTHSSVSSISNASGYANSYYGPASYNGSIDGSVTDYSSASEELNVRTLPAPTQMMNGFPPEPQSMMGQFNSKTAPNAQKKHKCKICEKRFTRPSSLQTHMYSHTGEKPFACEVEGCGRHFSVISNLRRHRKVHKDDMGSNASTGSLPSPSEE